MIADKSHSRCTHLTEVWYTRNIVWRAGAFTSCCKTLGECDKCKLINDMPQHSVWLRGCHLQRAGYLPGTITQSAPYATRPYHACPRSRIVLCLVCWRWKMETVAANSFTRSDRPWDRDGKLALAIDATIILNTYLILDDTRLTKILDATTFSNVPSRSTGIKGLQYPAYCIIVIIVFNSVYFEISSHRHQNIYDFIRWEPRAVSVVWRNIIFRGFYTLTTL